MIAPSLLRRVVLIVAGTVGASSLAACRCGSPTPRDDGRGPDATDGADAASSASLGPGPDEPTPHDSRDRRARGEASRRDAGTLDPACEGLTLSLLGAAADERCAVSEREWSELVQQQHAASGDGGGCARAGLRQEAVVDGDRIVVALVNGGQSPVTVPLRFHPARPELAFSVIAEDERHAVYELASPRPDATPIAPGAAESAPVVLRGLRAGPDGGVHVHSAWIRLPPGGRATARLTIDPRVIARLDRRCADAGRDGGEGKGDCLPSRLSNGPVVLHVGQLLAAIDAGAPARVAWELRADAPLR